MYPSPFEHGLFRPIFPSHPYRPPLGVNRTYSAAPAMFTQPQGPVRFQSAAPVRVAATVPVAGPVRRVLRNARPFVSERVLVSNTSNQLPPAVNQQPQLRPSPTLSLARPVYQQSSRILHMPVGPAVNVQMMPFNYDRSFMQPAPQRPPFRLTTPQLKCPLFPMRMQTMHEVETQHNPGSPVIGGVFSRSGTPAPHYPPTLHQRISGAMRKKASEEWIYNKSVGERVAHMEENLKENLRRNGSAYFFRVENY